MEFFTCCLGKPSVFFFFNWFVLIMTFFLLSWLVRGRSRWEAESTCLNLNVTTRRLAHSSWGQYALEMPAAQWLAPQCFRRSSQATGVHPKALRISRPPPLPPSLPDCLSTLEWGWWGSQVTNLGSEQLCTRLTGVRGYNYCLKCFL